MAATDKCLASMARLALVSSSRSFIYTTPRYLAPAMQTRGLMVIKKGPAKAGTKPKKKPLPKEFVRQSLVANNVPQYSLVEAMRILRAVEVGQPPSDTKYDLHINLRANRGGRVIRNSVTLPHPVRTSIRTAVICPDDSEVVKKAEAAGAVAVGENHVFRAIANGKEFDRVLCLDASLPALEKAQATNKMLQRKLKEEEITISVENGTVLGEEAIIAALAEAPESEPYREKQGIVAMPIGKLSFDPDMLKENVKAAMANINRDCNHMSDSAIKAVHEVLLSSTNGPALSLSGQHQHEDDVTDPKMLLGPM